MTDKTLQLLNEHLSLLTNATKILQYSFNKTKNIVIDKNCNQDEIDQLELLASRFARLSDILIKKIFRLIERIDLDDEGTIRDSLNKAEKKGLIKSAEIFSEIRILRNDFAHEYIPEAMTELFIDVVKFTPVLFDSVERVVGYCKKFK